MQFDALILARGGSKELSDLNTRDFAGRPLIAWSISFAKKCKQIRYTYVSTDNPAVMKVAKDLGARILVSPSELTRPEISDYERMQHFLKIIDEVPDGIVHLRPSCPIRQILDLEAMLEMFQNYGGGRSVRSVVPTDHTPFHTYTMNSQALVPLVNSLEGRPNPINYPSSELPPTYRNNGCIDIVSLSKGSVSVSSMLGYVMDPLPVENVLMCSSWEAAEANLKTDC